MQATYANYRELHVYERIVITRDGRRLAYVGPITPAIVADMSAKGVLIK
jgi:hypothetical protein